MFYAYGLFKYSRIFHRGGEVIGNQTGILQDFGIAARSYGPRGEPAMPQPFLSTFSPFWESLGRFK